MGICFRIAGSGYDKGLFSGKDFLTALLPFGEFQDVPARPSFRVVLLYPTVAAQLLVAVLYRIVVIIPARSQPRSHYTQQQYLH